LGIALRQRIAFGRAEWRAILVFGLCQNALYLGLNFYAMQTIEASVAVVVASLLPLAVAGLSRAVFGERLPATAIVALLGGLAGVGIIMAGRLDRGLDPVGVLLCLAGVLALAVATLSVRGASASGNLWMVVGLQMLVGALPLFAISVASEAWQIDWTPEMVLAFWYTVLVPGLAATMIWFVLVGRIGSTRAATFHFLNPFLGVAIAAVVLDEAITGLDLAGVALIMVSILAVQLSRPVARPARG
jgi:drug/metabolite transporter (DMT)-like permease